MPFHLALGLSNFEQVFEPGGTIEGFVTFDLRENIKVRLDYAWITVVSARTYILKVCRFCSMKDTVNKVFQSSALQFKKSSGQSDPSVSRRSRHDKMAHVGEQQIVSRSFARSLLLGQSDVSLWRTNGVEAVRRARQVVSVPRHPRVPVQVLHSNRGATEFRGRSRQHSIPSEGHCRETVEDKSDGAEISDGVADEGSECSADGR